MSVLLEEIEQEYKNWIHKKYGENHVFNVDELIDISLELYRELKVKEVEEYFALEGRDMSLDKFYDTLLFQYGTYSCKRGTFTIDITRRFLVWCDECEQENKWLLALALSFAPVDCEAGDCWTPDFDCLEKWVENIKVMEGYKIAKNLPSQKIQIEFSQW